MLAAMGLTGVQSLFFRLRERSLRALSVQLRIAYLALLLVWLYPALNWLFWWPVLGTYALNIFGYCLLARVLYLLPWNRQEPMSGSLMARTFLSRPRIPESAPESGSGCAGRLCTIEAQVRMDPGGEVKETGNAVA